MTDLTSEQLDALEAAWCESERGEGGRIDQAMSSGRAAGLLWDHAPALIAAARELARLRCRLNRPPSPFGEMPIRDLPDDLAAGVTWLMGIVGSSRPCSHKAERDEARSVLADCCAESGSTLAELDRLRAIEARAKEVRPEPLKWLGRNDSPERPPGIHPIVAGAIEYILTSERSWPDEPLDA